MAHNEWTLCLWVLWLRGQVSRKTKRKLKAGSIRSRVSLLVGLLSHRYGFRLVQDPIRLKALIKKLTAADPMAAVRRKRRGIRRRHLRARLATRAGGASDECGGARRVGGRHGSMACTRPRGRDGISAAQRPALHA